MQDRIFLMGCILAASLILAVAAHAQVSLPSIFSENMVLQRGMPVPIWGWAADGEKVKVTVYDGGKVLAHAETVATDGKWKLQLAKLPTGGRYTLLVQGDENMVMLSNVLVGEVWLICGQSNMLMPVSQSASWEEAKANRHKYPEIRVALIGRRNPHLVTEAKDEPKGFWGPVKWETATYTVPRSSRTDVPGSSSAVSYYFARELSKYLDGKVPVGMLEVGAIQRVESWVDEETVRRTPEIKHLAGKPYPHATSRSFNANIAPLAPYAIRGAIYYQGEMNAGNPREYGYGLQALIRSWRKAWNRPELPFLIVQLPGFIEHKQQHELDMDAESLARFTGNTPTHGFVGIRQAQLDVWRDVPHTGMAVTIDVGAPFDIHPPRKKPVGQRLFLQARKLVYGDKDLVASGPVPSKFQRKDATVIVHFDHVGEGFIAGNGPLQSFELSADGTNWLPAKAEIKADAVHVSHPNIDQPRAVRYAWRGYPKVSLYNREGLPATPFHHEFEKDD